MKPLRHPHLAQVFGVERVAEAEAAFAVDVDRRTPAQQEIARRFLAAMLSRVTQQLRSPEQPAPRRRPSTVWLRQ